MKIDKFLFIIFLSFSLSVFSQTKQDAELIRNNYDLVNIKKLELNYRNKELTEKSEAYKLASIKGWPLTLNGDNGSFQQLMKITPDGFPVYYSTFSNVAASISTRTNFLNTGGGLGLNLNGQNMTVGVWDGGVVRRSHSGFNNRVETIDDTGTNYNTDGSRHATHVTGTIIALPWSPTVADVRGMAFQANARTFNWFEDEAEAMDEASLGMLLSNHSYGIPITSVDGNILPAWFIGSYIEDSRVWDEIAFNAPFYLPVFSAGNDGGNQDNPEPLLPGIDKLVGNKVSKNVLTVANALDAEISTNGDLLSVDMNSSSSQGPTDDFRIKPDITGNGTGLLSTVSNSDTATVTYSGTSMAAPNVTGSLLLLQQHYFNLNNAFMKSATLKGLVCHTADDIVQEGPDPYSGWGLLNSKKAAETISSRGTSTIISELNLSQSQTFTLNINAVGGVLNPLVASITWTDHPGVANTGQRPANDTFKALVNDLDIRITNGGTIFYPWKLNFTDPTLPATRTNDNDVDNVEIIKIDNPVQGNYQIVISHKGTLTESNQNFSLIVSGVNLTLSTTDFNNTLISFHPNPTTDKLFINTSNITVSQYEVYDLQGRLVKSNKVNDLTNFIIDMNDINAGLYLVQIKTANGIFSHKIIKNN
ncbi:S8 family serine peptidase [Flavobacterium sp.]|jgi:hypothetical protein|uniref:S8 family serine peptidase n=1 Tax=Flavobacterium sp. TaxID=239 RepID=UPI0037BF7364